MKVRCIDAIFQQGVLEVGKVYEVEAIHPQSNNYKLVGITGNYHASRFVDAEKVENSLPIIPT